MKFENTEVFNFEGALRGIRNPLASWKKSDSEIGVTSDYTTAYELLDRVLEEYRKKEDINALDDEAIEALYDEKYNWLETNGINEYFTGNYYEDIVSYAFIGPNDLDLAQRLIAGGSEHRKFLRQIMVSVDITAPLYWFKEFDTYRIGVTENSTSTMHKLASTPITIDCFETDDMDESIFHEPPLTWFDGHTALDRHQFIIDTCEKLRQAYLETKDKRYWKELVRWLPNGWLQTRTVTLNYENLRSIYHQRKGHKLTEWASFLSWVESLPYAKELICS